MNKTMVKIGMFIGLLVISTVVSAHAQNTTRSRTEIPFDFIIDQRWHPAGTYELTLIDAKILTIASKDGNAIFAALVSANAAVEGVVGTKLSFHRIDDRYFLSKVVSADFGLTLKRTPEKKSPGRNARHADEDRFAKDQITVRTKPTKS